MTSERDVPPLRRSQPDSAAQAGAARGEGPPPREPQPPERYGPIAIARHVKDDGRALLLYTHTVTGEPT